MDCKYPGTDLTVAEVLPEKVMSIGENLQIRRFARFAENTTVAYVHAGGKIGVLVNLAVEGGIDATAIGKDVAMQIAALNPRFWDKSHVHRGRSRRGEEDPRCPDGQRSRRWLPSPSRSRKRSLPASSTSSTRRTACSSRPFVKDGCMSPSSSTWPAAAKELGGNVKFVDAVRFEKGEGIEKKQEDFAAEVAAQMNMGK